MNDLIRRLTSLMVAVASLGAALCQALPAVADEALSYEVRLETVMEHDDGKFLWYHPRPASVPGDGQPDVVMTLQKHFTAADDYYSGLSTMRRASTNGAWSDPAAVSELDWRRDIDGAVLSVADVTPGWHAPSGRLLAIGCQVPYAPDGAQILGGKARRHQTAYAVYNPADDCWSPWRLLEMPAEPKFKLCRNACSQWLVEPDGSLLLPLYFGPSDAGPWSVTVARCEFDGDQLRYLQHGDELSLEVDRGLVEPSIVKFDGRYFLTIRNDQRAYVSVSDDGLHWAPIKAWTFDDGRDLGSYNTQQHWLAHSDGLFLVYTRRGADNDHIVRHRAPLLMARIDPAAPQVVRATERILIPERGGELGNFGAAAISDDESWVTVSEGVWSDDARRRGAKGATFVARITWSKPNKLAPTP